MTFHSGLVDTHDLFKGSSVRFILNLLRTHLGTISFSGGTIFNLGTASLSYISIWALNLGSQSGHWLDDLA